MLPVFQTNKEPPETRSCPAVASIVELEQLLQGQQEMVEGLRKERQASQTDWEHISTHLDNKLLAQGESASRLV